MKAQPQSARRTSALAGPVQPSGPPIGNARGAGWLRNFFPGYFALVMGSGIVAVAAQLLDHPLLAWPLFVIALLAYAVLWPPSRWRC